MLDVVSWLDEFFFLVTRLAHMWSVEEAFVVGLHTEPSPEGHHYSLNEERLVFNLVPSLPPSLLAARSPPGVPSGRCKADHQILIRPTWKQPAEINSTAAQLIISLSLVKHARGAEGGSMVCVCVHASQWDRCVRAGLVTVVLSDWWRCAVRRRLGAILCPLGCGGRADGREALDRSYLIKMQMSFRVCVFMHEYVHTCCMCGPARCQGWSLWYLYSHVYIPHTRY